MSDREKVSITVFLDCYKRNRKALCYYLKEYEKTTERAKKRRAKLESDMAYSLCSFTGAFCLLESIHKSDKLENDYKRILELLQDKIGLS